jgi:hypothetical protein
METCDSLAISQCFSEPSADSHAGASRSSVWQHCKHSCRAGTANHLLSVGNTASKLMLMLMLMLEDNGAVKQ